MKKIVTTLFAVCSIVGLHAQTDTFSNNPQDSVAIVLPWPQNVQARLDTLMQDPLLETTQLGLMVYDLTADSVLYRHGERQLMRPASTMKLVTAVTAIDVLGGNYLYRTTLRYKGTVKDSVLTGDLYCVGCLDPMFDDAARLIVHEQSGSTSLIQRKFAIGYNRAGRLMDQLEKAGIVGQAHGSKPREVLIQDDMSLENLLNSLH